MIFIRLYRINRPVLEIKAGEDYIHFPSTTFRASNPTLERVKNKTENFMLERMRLDKRTVLMTARVVYFSRTIIHFCRVNVLKVPL